MKAISPAVEASEDTNWDQIFRDQFKAISTATMRIKAGQVVQCNRPAEYMMNDPVGEFMMDIFDIDGGFGEGGKDTCPVMNEGEGIGKHISGLPVKIVAIPPYWDALGVVVYVIPLNGLEDPSSGAEALDQVDSKNPETSSVAEKALSQSHPVFAGDPRSRLKEYTDEEMDLIESRCYAYVQVAETAALEAILDEFNNVCEENATTEAMEVPSIEVQAVIESLMHLGMAFQMATELARDISEEHGLDLAFDVSCMSLLRMN